MSIVTFILIYVPSEIRDQRWPVGGSEAFILESSLNYRFTKHGPGNLWRDGNKLYLCLIWVHKATKNLLEVSSVVASSRSNSVVQTTFSIEDWIQTRGGIYSVVHCTTN